MIYSEEYIKKLLDHTLTRVTPPAGAGIVFEGSIAEGFGNAGSDIDFLIVTEKDENRPVLPLIIFHDGKRIEVRYRAATVLKDQLQALAKHKNNKKVLKKLLEDTMNRLQRFLHSLTLTNEPLINSIKNILSYEDFSILTSNWFKVRAVERLEYAVALNGLGETGSAKNWIQAGIIEAAKSWAAQHGEAYISKKWTFHQLERGNADKDIIKKFKTLYFDSDKSLSNDDYLTKALELAEYFTGEKIPNNLGKVRIKRKINVTTWHLGENIHVIRDKKDVMLMSGDTGKVWKNLLFETSMTEVLDYIKKSIGEIKDVGKIIVKLQKLQLIDFSWGGKKKIAVGNLFDIPPTVGFSQLAFDGMIKDENGDDIQLSPVPVKKFTYSGISLIFINIVVENTWEDFYGALKNEQWSVCEHRLREMVRHFCMLLLCSFGLAPDPPLEDIYEDLIYYLKNTKKFENDLMNEILSFEPVIIRNADEANELKDKVEVILKKVRNIITNDLFPNCFDSEDDWQKALDLAYDWVRMSAYVDSKFPVEEARDLLATGGGQPHLG